MRIYFCILTILLCSCHPLNNEHDYRGFEVEDDSDPQTIDMEDTIDTTDETEEEYRDEHMETQPDDETNMETEEEDTIEEKEEAHDPSATGKVLLQMGDFIGRWNGISDEFTFERKITTLDFVEENAESYYFTDLGHSQLKIYVHSPNEVYRIEITGRGHSKEAKYSMMTQWWQLILTMNPEKEPHEIDMALTELNIGANADFSSLTEEKIPFEDQLFFVERKDNSYTFILTFLGEKQIGTDGGDSA